MKRVYAAITLLSFFIVNSSFSQQIDPWKITASNYNPTEYYGVTVANGMIGIVSSPEPFKVKDVVLAGAYDLYGRGRVSNFLRSFNLLNMYFGFAVNFYHVIFIIVKNQRVGCNKWQVFTRFCLYQYIGEHSRFK